MNAFLYAKMPIPDELIHNQQKQHESGKVEWFTIFSDVRNVLNLGKQFKRTMRHWGMMNRFTCIPHSIDIVRDVDSPNDILETQYPRANEAACRKTTGNTSCAPWAFNASEASPIWKVNTR